MSMRSSIAQPGSTTNWSVGSQISATNLPTYPSQPMQNFQSIIGLRLPMMNVPPPGYAPFTGKLRI